MSATHGTKRRILKALILLLFIFIGCPKHEVRKPKVRKDIVRPTAAPQDVLETSPQREASQKVVEIGMRHFLNGDYEQAERSFQEAISIDGNNGMAYFFLAKTRMEKGQYQEAAGLLDKAESLLQNRSDVLKEIAELRATIRVKEEGAEEQQTFY